MQAAILTELKKPLAIGEVCLPEALDVGQVLVRIHYSGICGSQLGEIDGAKGEDKFLPHLLGHEGSGAVVDIGPGVKHVKPGDKVVLHWRKGLGIESPVPSYRWNGEKLNAGWITTFNEFAVVSENRVTRIPPDSDMRVAALFGCAVTTGFGVVLNNANLKIGESVVVFGAGGVGLNIVQAAAMVSAYPIVAVDRFENRLELARRLGATHTVNASLGDPRAEILRAVADTDLDVFIDNTGQPAIIEMGYELVKPQGRLILVGVPRKGAGSNIYTLPLHFGKMLTGSHGGEAIPQSDIPRYLRLARTGRLQLEPLLTNDYLLPDINSAIQSLRDGTISGRCLVAFPGGN